MGPDVRGGHDRARVQAGTALACWLPMGTLLAAALGLGPFLSAWLWRWTLSVAIFAGFKWATLVQALAGGVRPATP